MTPQCQMSPAFIKVGASPSISYHCLGIFGFFSNKDLLRVRLCENHRIMPIDFLFVTSLLFNFDYQPQTQKNLENTMGGGKHAL